jgi:hypothetical protein
MAGATPPNPDEDLDELNARIAKEGADATTAGARDKAAGKKSGRGSSD